MSTEGYHKPEIATGLASDSIRLSTWCSLDIGMYQDSEFELSLTDSIYVVTDFIRCRSAEVIR